MGEMITISSKSAYDRNVSGIITDKPKTIYLQFVPGIVKDVATGIGSKSWVSRGDTNSIIAKSHAPSKTEFKSFASDKRY